MACISYFDLNCPFCFALNERLVRLGVEKTIDWRGVLHLPQIQTVSRDPLDAAEIMKEVEGVKDRAPEIRIRQPDFRPATQAANALVGAIALEDPDRAADLRTALFRAYWQQSRNLADTAILKDLTPDHDTPPPERIREAGRHIQKYSLEWRNGPFDRRLPSMQRSDGQVLVGFPTEEDLRLFLADEAPGCSRFTGASQLGRDNIIAAIGLSDTLITRLRWALSSDHELHIDGDNGPSPLTSEPISLVILGADADAARLTPGPGPDVPVIGILSAAQMAAITRQTGLNFAMRLEPDCLPSALAEAIRTVQRRFRLQRALTALA